MAKHKGAAEAAQAGTVTARALVDLGVDGIKAGEFFDAPAEMVAAFVAGGMADDQADEAATYPDGAPARKVWGAAAEAAAAKSTEDAPLQ